MDSPIMQLGGCEGRREGEREGGGKEGNQLVARDYVPM